jgi:outer membrane protein assembly factor BamB
MRFAARSMLWILCFALASIAAASLTRAADWAQWGGTPSKNMVAPADVTGLPTSAKVALTPDDQIDIAGSTNVKWAAPLGTQTYGNPIVAGGRVYVGTNNDRPRDPRHQGDRGILLCLDEKDGKFLWQLVVPKLTGGKAVDFEAVGLCSSPTVESDRVYVMTNRCEILCLDAAGMVNGNDGPFKDESTYFAPEGSTPIEPGPTDADILWRYSMYDELGVFPHQQAAGSVLIVGDKLYTTTSNGIDWTNAHYPAPDAPALICLDKNTGKLLGEERSGISSRTFRCNWSSPAFGKAGDREMVVFGGGDGFCYGFEPNPVDGVLKEIWRFDCNPPKYKINPKNNKPIKYGNSKGYSEICSTPVVHDGKVYVATGQDPESGDGVGNLSCIDASKTGDLTESGKVWAYDKIGRTLSTVSIADGVVYAADYSGKVHCLDAKTGEEKWEHDTEGRIWGSTLVADGKIYVGTEERQLVVLKAGSEDEKVGDIELDGPIYSTPIVANGVMFLTTDKTLFALHKSK